MQFELGKDVVLTQEVIVVFACMISLIVIAFCYTVCCYQLYQPEQDQKSEFQLTQLVEALPKKISPEKDPLASPQDHHATVKTHSFERVPDGVLLRMDSDRV